MSEKIVPSAKVVDGILILSLPDASLPVVWQMEVGQSKSSALEVRPDETKEDGKGFILVLKTPRQDVLEIAKYDTRDGAVRALMTVSVAMEKAQGQMRLASALQGQGQRSSAYDYSVPALRPEKASHVAKFAFKTLGYLFGGLVLLFVLFLLAAFAINIFAGPNGSGGTSAASTQNSPVSAEDFLEGR